MPVFRKRYLPFAFAVLLGGAALAAVALYRAPRADRPAGVGNALGEAFIRKLRRPAPVVPPTGPIVLDDKNFPELYAELYDRRWAYWGREVEFSGSVEGPAAGAPGALLVGRSLIWCCPDDAYFIGFPVVGAAFKPGDALRVRGVLFALDCLDRDGRVRTEPALRVLEAERLPEAPPPVRQR